MNRAIAAAAAEAGNTRSLRALDLEDAYRSDQLSIARDFYVPCLVCTTSYSRAAGYFTSSSLSAVASGLAAFIESGGRMRLVASPQLNEDDAEAVAAGYAQREQIVEQALTRALEADHMPDPTRERLAVLAWLVAEGRLDIKIALVEREASVGIYHEKFGIFEDAEGDYVAFSGSANESGGGLVTNFEVVDVYRSWEPADTARAKRKRAEFEALWQGKTSALAIYDFPAAARERLLHFAPPGGGPAPPPGDERELLEQTRGRAGSAFDAPRMPNATELWQHQREAIDEWLSARGRGIWEMATGTGKTITALAAVTEVARRARIVGRPLLTVVVCPLVHLVTQWSEEARSFAIEPLPCFGSSAQWSPRVADLLAGLRASPDGFLLMITTNDTFAAPRFQEHLNGWRGPVLVIVDEVHNAGSRRMLAALPDQGQYRLGLSATPRRWLDDEGTAGIVGYFGDTVYSLTLKQAVDRGILSPYRYYPVEVALEDDETELYLDLSRRIGALMARAGGDVDDVDSASPGLQMLLFARARLTGGARGKLVALRQLMESLRDTTHNLVYCSDATMLEAAGEEEGSELKQLEAAVSLLGHDLGMRVNSYTHRDSAEDRTRMRDQFARGELQALVAIRCLDEGVDIPATRRAFILASSTNPRQFIQRRGRVLRKAPGKARADVYDFLVVPPAGALTVSDFETERRLVQKELSRVAEFANGAQNGPEALASLLPIRKRYNLLDQG